MWRVPRPANRTRLYQRRSEEVGVGPSRPVLPIVPLVVRLRAQREVVGVDAEPVMAAMSDDLIVPHDGPLEDAVDEPVGVGSKGKFRPIPTFQKTLKNKGFPPGVSNRTNS